MIGDVIGLVLRDGPPQVGDSYDPHIELAWGEYGRGFVLIGSRDCLIAKKAIEILRKHEAELLEARNKVQFFDEDERP